LKQEQEASHQDRLKDKAEIEKFINAVFGAEEFMEFEKYKEINAVHSSEMLYSLMR